MIRLLDVNVLVAVLHGGHMHCEAAMAWLDGQDEAASIGICRVVQMGALRLLTRHAVMGEDVVTAREFWRGWDRVMLDERWVFVAEPSGIEEAWRKLTLPIPKGSCAETDAYLAALTIAVGGTLVTFDRGFRRFAGLSVELLSSRDG